MKVPVHGVLGDNFLRHYKIETDYPAREIRFLPLRQTWSREASAPAFETTFESLDGENFPTVPEIFVNGTALRATLDTGSNVGVTRCRAYASDLSKWIRWRRDSSSRVTKRQLLFQSEARTWATAC